MVEEQVFAANDPKDSMASARIYKLFTLIFVKRESEVLLGYKKRGFGVGKWNGFGGKLEKKESLFDGAKRELKEECNLEALELNHLGLVFYQTMVQPLEHHEVHIFTTEKFQGAIKESEEMRPQWFKIEEIPFKEMWPDFFLWCPLMLENKFFVGSVLYNTQMEIRNYKINVYNSLDEALVFAKSKIR